MRFPDAKGRHIHLLALVSLVLASALWAQTPAPAPAPPTGRCTPPQTEELIRIPELQAKDGKLRGTIIASAEQECVGSRVPPTAPSAGATLQWSAQWMRTMRGVDTVPPNPITPPNTYGNPLPGPTLRARVGDLIELTLLNQIDVGVFPASQIDQGDKGPQGGCDQTTLYPGSGANADTFPDCFHGSSTVNVHFHGTHTNPNSTGDNVFIEIRPSPRTKDQANKPIVTAASVKAPFDEFFRRCEAELPSSDQLRQWPFTWSAFPTAYTAMQERLLKEYDKNPRVRPLWPTNAAQLAKGEWPQYYIGAYPYCYRLPDYKSSTFPPETSAAATSVHTHGAGSAEQGESTSGRALLAGQAPGTHWYHAHKHGSTAIDVANGITGAFIIEGKYDDDLDVFYGAGWTRSQKVMVINQIGGTPNLEIGGGGTTKPGGKGQGLGQDKGPDFSVNGRFTPIVKMAPGEVQLWRIVNSSSRAGAYLASPPAGFQWKQLAQDGVQFNDTAYQAHLNTPITLYPGNRADILVMAPATAPSTPAAFKVQNMVDPSDLPSAYAMTLLSVNVTGSPAVRNYARFIPTAPERPPYLADITEAEIKGTRKIVFASKPPGSGQQHTIDGRQFNGEVGEVVLLNTVEEWKVSNETYGPLISHPFHIHINPFQVTEVFAPNEAIPGTTTPRYVFDRAAVTTPGQCLLDPFRPETWKPCYAMPAGDRSIWYDVYGIPSGANVVDAQNKPINNPVTGKQIQAPGYFKMRSRFVDYSGYYVIHCHILAHEDRGMMTIVEVAPLQSPFSHH
jgi:FtsP/CotA-like multicopper oxidase with cupredoxin domain